MKLYVLVEETINRNNKLLADRAIALPDEDACPRLLKEMLNILVVRSDGSAVDMQKKWDDSVELTLCGARDVPRYQKLPRWLMDHLHKVGEDNNEGKFDLDPVSGKMCIAFEVSDKLMHYINSAQRKLAEDHLYQLTSSVIGGMYTKYINKMEKLGLYQVYDSAKENKDSKDHRDSDYQDKIEKPLATGMPEQKKM